MKKYSILLFVAGLLAGCSSNGAGVSVGLGLGSMLGSRVGLGTSVNVHFPIEGQKTPSPSDTGAIRVIEEKIITYFDANGQAVDSSVKGGYMRQLLSKQGEHYWVQDFYATGEKRTDPVLLSRAQLFTFRAQPRDGVYTVYAINGVIMSQQNFRDGKGLP